MALTRTLEFPAEAAQLMAAFDRCSGGYAVDTVVEASVQMVIKAFHVYGRSKGSLDEARTLADKVGAQLADLVEEQWNRTPRPTDIPVRGGH